MRVLLKLKSMSGRESKQREFVQDVTFITFPYFYFILFNIWFFSETVPTLRADCNIQNNNTKKIKIIIRKRYIARMFSQSVSLKFLTNGSFIVSAYNKNTRGIQMRETQNYRACSAHTSTCNFKKKKRE